jgi:hypothetical protein
MTLCDRRNRRIGSFDFKMKIRHIKSTGHDGLDEYMKSTQVAMISILGLGQILIKASADEPTIMYPDDKAAREALWALRNDLVDIGRMQSQLFKLIGQENDAHKKDPT